MAQKARFIFHAILVDLMFDAQGSVEKTDAGSDKEPDVVAEISLCALSPEEAGAIAFNQFKAEGIVQPGRRYYLHMILYSPLPQTGGQIIVPNAGEAKAILRSGEVVGRPDNPQKPPIALATH